MGMGMRVKMKFLEYFMNELLERRLERTIELYSLEMSLEEFYRLLINYFFIDTILNPSSNQN